MVRLELQDEQAGWLSNSIQNYLSHLNVEIAHTDRKDFREALKKRAAFLEDVIKMLKKST